MKRFYTYCFFCCLVVLSACVDEDFFGYSPYGNIKSIEFSNQASQAIIHQDDKTVEVEFPPGIDLSSITLQSLALSSFATANLNPGDIVDFNNSIFIEVMAEDGSKHMWEVIPFTGSSAPQLPNQDFNLWYQTGGGYFEPGADAASTVWGTGNPGTQILGLTATTPLELEENNLAVHMETLDNGRLAGTFGAPISAGSIFTGKFNSDNIDPTDPEAAIDFGTPFSGRPSAIQFTYQYEPGPENKNKNGDLLPYGDACDIYAYLEVRSADGIQRLATAWFRSDEVVTEPTQRSVEFVYGELDDTFPQELRPENDNYVTGDSIDFVLPTHITFVSSSSFDGANFAGAIGSVLLLDDLEFVYEE